ncbi:MAG: valine--pyruvate transaminase [Cocleimonas sp.]
MTFSRFGNKFTRPNGITQLMDDLGKANSVYNPNMVMLGGGNPAIIPESNTVFINELQQLINSADVDNMVGLYDGPQGFDAFREALANMLNEHFAWGLDADNIALSNGSQSNFFSLFNLLAGEMDDGSQQKILFPLAPEYVGYADQGLSENMFVSIKPSIQHLENNQFKYEIDFDALKLTLASEQKFGAICVSRPTNPTGNVITDAELKTLDELAQHYGIPLIVDNAYGHPFPGAIYTDATLSWNANTILCMSLSKLGLPGLRTGIVVANKNIISAISRINGIMILAPNSVGPTLMTRLINNKELLPLCENIIKPYYQQKAKTAVALFDEIFADLPVYLHKLEGAFFMWLWFKDMRFTSEELYEKLKEEEVYIIPGHNFFIGIDDGWQHKHECIRINYAKDEDTLRKGLEAIKRIVG